MDVSSEVISTVIVIIIMCIIFAVIVCNIRVLYVYDHALNQSISGTSEIRSEIPSEICRRLFSEGNPVPGGQSTLSNLREPIEEMELIETPHQQETNL